jgi:hypothetical protein
VRTARKTGCMHHRMCHLARGGRRRQYCQGGTASRLCPAYQLKPPPLPIMCKWCMTTALQGYSTPHTQGVAGRPPCLCMGGVRRRVQASPPAAWPVAWQRLSGALLTGAVERLPM